MTTFQPTHILSEVLDGKSVIPVGTLAYFRGRFTNRIHELVLSEFAKLERENKITKAELARRIGRKPEQITRWLGSPGNWELETVSDLLLSMGYEPAIAFSPLSAATSPEENPRLAGYQEATGAYAKPMLNRQAANDSSNLPPLSRGFPQRPQPSFG